MAFSLSNWFKGKPDSLPGSAEENAPATAKSPAPTPAPAVPTPTTVRQVVPNSVQPVSLRDPSYRPPVQQLPVAAASPAGRMTPVLSPTRKISFGKPTPVLGGVPEQEMPAPFAVEEPEPVITQPQSVPDVIVTLEVGDFIDRVPPNFLSGDAVDRHHRVEFHSTELYSDLSKGRASVPASIIYQKCPELFCRPVSETEDVEVALPLQKLVEQLSPALHTRADQVAEENVGEIETPFLQVANEDNARLPKAAGTTAGPVRPVTALPEAAAPASALPTRAHRTGQIQTISPLKAPVELPQLAAPTAQSVGPINSGKRPPSTVRASVAGGKIRLSGPSVPNRMVVVAAPAPPPLVEDQDVELPPSASQRIASPMQAAPSMPSPSHDVSKKTARIQIPPISLRKEGSPGSPGSPRPPATPVAAPAVPVQASPVAVHQSPPAASPQITFRSSQPPPSSVKPMPHSFAPPPPRPSFPPPAFPVPTPPAGASEPPVPARAPDDRKIELGLAAILRGMSSSLLTVEPSSIPDDLKIALPFSLVEPQLSTGRVSVPRDVFVHALPENHREVLDSGAEPADVPLPLQEVFQNLPSSALALREDQVTEEVGTAYPTPFSQKAEEDAQRLGAGEIPFTGAPKVEPAAGAEPGIAPSEAHAIDRPISPEPPSDSAEEFNLGKLVDVDESSHEEDSSNGPRDIPLDLSETPQPGSREAADHSDQSPAAQEPVESLASRMDEAHLPVADDAIPEVAIPVPSEEPAAGEPAHSHLSGNGAQAPAHVAEQESAAAPVAAAPAPHKSRDTELQSLFMTEDDLDAKTVVKLVSALPGVTGCAIMFGDGLRLAGNFPESGDRDGFSAMAPPFFKKTMNFANESQIGAIKAFTLYADDALFSFFMHETICMSVRHSGRGFLPGVREKLEIVVRELARMYSDAKPAAANEDAP